MDAVFENAVDATTPVVETVADNSAKKEKVNTMRQALKDTIQSEPDFVAKLHRFSDSIMVVNTLGYGKNGNIVVDKKSSTEDKRALKPTSMVCGYRLQNIGTEAIPYTTEVYTPDENGKYVGQVVKRQWAPGETISLNRQYTTMLCSIPEISFTLANGKIVASSKKNSKSLKEELASYYFSFDKDDSGYKSAVNDDEVKLAVDDADGRIKEEFLETFGYLNNPKEGKAPRQKSQKFSTQDLAANYINKLIQEQGLQ